MRLTGLLLLPLALAAGLGACAHAPSRPQAAGETVEAEGWGVATEDFLATRERALADAQKKAVEKVTGLVLTARTEVKNALSVEQDIRARVSGAIENYEVLEERQEDGFLKIKIRARVLFNEAVAFGAQHNLKIKVSIDDLGVGDAVSKALRDLGFPDVDLQDVKPDVIVTGQGKAYPQGRAPLGGFRSYRARVTLTAMDVKTGKKTNCRREASAIDPVNEIAAEKALETAGRMAVEALAAKYIKLDPIGEFGMR